MHSPSKDSIFVQDFAQLLWAFYGYSARIADDNFHWCKCNLNYLFLRHFIIIPFVVLVILWPLRIKYKDGNNLKKTCRYFGYVCFVSLQTFLKPKPSFCISPSLTFYLRGVTLSHFDILLALISAVAILFASTIF